MKECKEKAILPCYSDDTHDKVYELNKQMCDIGKAILTKKKNDMTEKKTKKMTKAEAFEWLKGKKIKCICAVAYEDAQANKVESFLKDVGCKYHFVNHISWRDWYWPLYGFIVDKKGEIYVAFENQMDFFIQDFNEEISADDILSIEIVEEKKEPLDKWEEFASKVAKIQETLDDDEVCIITKTNYLTMTK
jgi:hypothetical protein